MKKTMEKISEIVNKNGYPQLCINGEIQDGLAYITYLTENNRYTDFAKAGYRLFSVPVFFGFNHLNELSGLNVFKKGIFDNNEPDYSTFDRDIKQILDACPDAYIFPRVNVSLSRNWELQNPDELCDPYPDGTPSRASFASDKWAEEVKREIRAFINHVQSSDYESHIVGYQVAGGNTEEWLPFDVEKGISGKRTTEKFENYAKANGIENSESSFFRFYSELVAERIIEFSSLIKSLTDRRLIVGTFYGYTFSCPYRSYGHHAMLKILESDEIDFICSPICYSNNRDIGRDHPYMTALASIKQHGKLYFSENDTRTHLSRAVNDMDHYNKTIWFGPDQESSCDVIKMHASRALINNHAAWWFDMWGGWFADDTYMALLKNIRELFEKNATLKTRAVAQTAVFVDEESYALISDNSVTKSICYDIREALGKMGAPYDVYLSADAPSVIGSYKAIISLVPIETKLSRNVKALAEQNHCFLIEITSANYDITSSELRVFLHNSGVHVYCDRDSVIYANDRFLFLHTSEEGEYTLNLKNTDELIDVFTGKSFVQGQYLKKGKSFLFYFPR
jgi:beta-galactosidase